MLVLSKALERLNKYNILFIAEHLIAQTFNFWAPLSNHGIQIIRLTYPIKNTQERLQFIITKISKNFSKEYDCAMNNTLKIPYF